MSTSAIAEPDITDQLRPGYTKKITKPPNRVRRLCRDRKHVMSILARYGEAPQMQGIAGNYSYAVQMYLNPTTRTWSFVTFYPSGITCIDGSGLMGELFRDDAYTKPS